MPPRQGVTQLDVNYTDRLARLFSRALHQQLMADLHKGGRLTASQFQALSFIERHQGCTVGELAAGLAVSCPAATKLVDRLTAKQLATRAPSPHDRRQVQVTLSAAGQAALGEVEQARRQLLGDAVGSLPRPRHLGLVRGLEALLARLVGDADTARALCLHCGEAHLADCPLNRLYRALTGIDLPH